jgi:hypothetical protein
MATTDDLLTSIFDGLQPTFYPEFEAWVRESRRFKAFAVDYRVKIRAKLKNVQDEAGAQDLRAELETAAQLLTEKRFALEYEKYAASRQRGPDFTVTFKTHTPFNVEVRRIRSVEIEDGGIDAPTGKLLAVICDKVGQMLPGIVNLLWLVAEREISEADLARVAATLRQLAERKDETFFTRNRFESAADFLKQYRRLSGIVVSQPGGNALWLNPLARHKIPPDIVTAIRRLGPV